MPTFGESLKLIREQRRITTNALAGASGVDHGNLYRLESGKRPAMSLRMCFELVMALPDTTPEERKWLMDVAIMERTTDEWYRYLIYEFVATADSATLDRVMRAARASLFGDEAAHAILQDQSAVQLLLTLAERPEVEFVQLRAALAPLIAKRITINTADQSVEVE